MASGSGEPQRGPYLQNPCPPLRLLQYASSHNTPQLNPSDTKDNCLNCPGQYYLLFTLLNKHDTLITLLRELMILNNPEKENEIYFISFSPWPWFQPNSENFNCIYLWFLEFLEMRTFESLQATVNEIRDADHKHTHKTVLYEGQKR